MEAPRLAPLEPPYEPEVASELEKLMPPGVDPLLLFRTLAHNPRVLGRFRRGGLLDPGSITPREREIVIHRTCARCGSEYEWGVHAVVFGRRYGLTDEQLAATVHGSAEDPAWSAREALLIRLVDQLHDTDTVRDSLWEELSKHWNAAQLVELVVLVGFYHTVSFITNAARVQLEEAAERFPAPIQ
jgi:4-carboxymuconolactone decarboxylase